MTAKPQTESNKRPSGTSVEQMAQGSGINLVGAVCAQGSLFVLTAFLAVYLGGEDVGGFAECYALYTLLGLVGLAGFRATLTRFVAIHLADEDSSALRGTLTFGIAFTLSVAIVISTVLALLSHEVAGLFHSPQLRLPILLIAIAIPASTFESAALSATQGWRSQTAYATIGLIVDPGVRLGLTVILVLLGGGIAGAMWAIVIASWVGALLSGIALHRRVRTVPAAPRRYLIRKLFSFSLISWGSTLATTGLVWADILLLGHLSTQNDVGVYTIASRLVTLAIFVMMPINNAFTPHVANLIHRGDRDGASTAFTAATRWIVRLSAPSFIFILIFPDALLSLFGQEYAIATGVTIVLAFGQIVNACIGPCLSVLNMSDHVRISLIDNVTALVLNIGLNLWLIPRYGIFGAALAWAASLAVLNIAQAIQVRLIVGIRTTGLGMLPTLGAAVLAALSALLLRHLVDDALVRSLAGVSVVFTVFALCLWIIGIGAEDMETIRSLRGQQGVGKVGR